jgi:hypothetical protein
MNPFAWLNSINNRILEREAYVRAVNDMAGGWPAATYERFILESNEPDAVKRGWRKAIDDCSAHRTDTADQLTRQSANRASSTAP